MLRCTPLVHSMGIPEMQIRMKLAVIAGLMLLMAIPLLLLVSKIYERDSYEEQARWDIAASWTGEQRLLGPILVVPYVLTKRSRVFDKSLQQYVYQSDDINEQLFILPEQLDADVDLTTEVRYRGIYEIPVYASSISLHGSYSNEQILRIAQRQDFKEVGTPYLSVLVGDMRGIVDLPSLAWGGAKGGANTSSTEVGFEPGSEIPFDKNGIHAPLTGLSSEQETAYSFTIELRLRGMSKFRYAPIGESSVLDIRSNWPHPGFDGLYLPAEREITNEGFTARYETSVFSTNFTTQAEQCLGGDCSAFRNNTLAVNLVDPVDVYLQAQRATKYGILFIGLTFTAFFLFEVLKQLAIHPIQYGLVGLALSLFYLLLVSLAEHLPFAQAYLIATLACCGLLGFYVSFVLKSWRRGSLFAAAIASLYGVLYIIIEAEDYAFSMGAALVFATLAIIMFATRNIDWYALSKNSLTR